VQVAVASLVVECFVVRRVPGRGNCLPILRGVGRWRGMNSQRVREDGQTMRYVRSRSMLRALYAPGSTVRRAPTICPHRLRYAVARCGYVMASAHAARAGASGRVNYAVSVRSPGACKCWRYGMRAACHMLR